MATMKKKPPLKQAPESRSALEEARRPVTRDFHGHLDTCGPTQITGWLYDRANVGEACEVEIRVDGRPVARATADLFRIDLLEKNIGDGLCGFQLALPASLFDGAPHLVSVQEATTGFALAGSPRELATRAASRGGIKFENGSLTGSARLKFGAAAGSELEVLDLETGKVIAVGLAQAEGANTGTVRFSIPLPAAVFDGRPHAFSVRSQKDAALLQDIALVMPHMATPEEALLKFARNGMAPALATAAGFRYDSLAASLEKLARAQPGETSKKATGTVLAAQVAQLTRVHARLVRGFNPRDVDFDPLVFPACDKPVASIVIPVHNKFHVTYHALASLLLAPNDASFEVILVDDGSSDETLRAAELVTGIQILRNEKSRGFIHACNRGAASARGRYVVMLNNDTEVTAGWLDELIWPFENFEGVGMTGAKLLYADGSLQEAGGIVWSSGNPWNYGRGGNAHEPRYNYARQVDYVSGACMMLPLQLWRDIGGFSEDYAPAYFEDTDLAFQVRARGLKTVFTPRAQVFHFEGMSNGTDTTSATKRYQEINRPKFKRRWTKATRGNGREGEDIELNKDRNITLRALVIDSQIPMPDQDAGSYAAVQEIRMLQALGFKCTFIPQNLAWMGHYTHAMQRMGVECLHAPFQTSITQVLQERGAEFDLVYITRYHVAQNWVAMIRQHAPRAKIVLMNADLHFLRELRLALQTGDQAGMDKSLQTRQEELAVMRDVDLVLCYTEVERAVIISHNLDATKVAICPWVTAIAKNVPAFDGRRDIAFLGGFNHPPNLAAVEWFVANVMPLLRIELPGIKFRVYGSQMPESLLNLAATCPDLVLEGWIPTVDLAYNKCLVFVAPLQSGAGIKGKVIGALAHGTPTVMSPVAAEGITVGDGLDGVIAERPEQWVSAIAALTKSQSNWTAASRRALEYANSRYGFERGVEQMQRALEEAQLFATPASQGLWQKDF